VQDSERNSEMNNPTPASYPRDGIYSCKCCGVFCFDNGGDAENSDLCEVCYALNINEAELSYSGTPCNTESEVLALLNKLDAFSGAGKAAELFPSLALRCQNPLSGDSSCQKVVRVI